MCKYKFEIGEEVIPVLACGRDGVAYNERMKKLVGKTGFVIKRSMRHITTGCEEFYSVGFGRVESWNYFADWLTSASALVESEDVENMNQFLSEFEVIE